MTLPILFTATVVALIVALNAIGLRRHWQAWRESRRESGFAPKRGEQALAEHAERRKG